MIAEANLAQDRFKAIDAILENYDVWGGSSSISMAQLRDQVAQVYSPSAPDFIFHWSAFARVAIALDHAQRRIEYGTVDELPENADPLANPPYVLSRKVRPTNDASYYRPPRGFIGKRLPAGFKTADLNQNLEDLSMFPAGKAHHQSQPIPPSPPPPPFQPKLPSIGPPSSTGKRKNRRRHRRQTSSVKHGEEARGGEIPLALRVSATREPEASGSNIKLSTAQPSSNLADRIAPIPATNVAEKQPTRPIFKEQKRKRHESPPSTSSLSNSSSDGDFNPLPAPADSEAPAFSGSEGEDDDEIPFLAHNEHLSPEAFTPLSSKIQKIAIRYKSNIKKYISLFNSCGNRPANWHNNLTKDLLEYNFVDLRKLYGEVSSNGPSESFLKVNDVGKLKSINGAPPKEITNSDHWKDLMAVARHAYIAAFPPAAVSIKKYFDYIFGLPGLFQAKVNWEDVRDFDVEMRKEFSSRPWLVWGDYTHESLRGIDNRVLYSAASRLSQTARAAIPTPLPPRAETQSTPYTTKAPRPAQPKKPRGRRNKPNYTVKPAKGTMSATEYTICATKLDAMALIKEALLTNEPNSCRFLRGLEIDALSEGYSASVESSLHAEPLPAAPPIESDPLAAYAIKQRPDIFKITCPINIKNFSLLLKNHPNRPFVDSIVLGLSEGFWPLSAKPSDDITYHKNHVSGPEAEKTLQQARDKELKAGRYSPPFYTLLPGMKVSPLCLATNPNSGKVRTCTNMSFGRPSPNDLINKEKIKIDLDSIASFIPHLLIHHRSNHRVLIWKSDVDGAFRVLPASLQWQLRQIVKIGKAFHADRNVNFGCSSSPKLWCSFFSLVLWIAYYEFGITELNSYMDNSWGSDLTSSLVNFKGRSIPRNQAKFLTIFDYIGLPWAWEKQLHGTVLEVIGHTIDCDKLSITLSEKKRSELISALRLFTSKISHPLVEWQRLTGWANWALNIFPLGRWSIQSSWDKMSGKSIRSAHIPLNRTNKDDLNWLANALEAWEGSRPWHMAPGHSHGMVLLPAAPSP
ncbi:uncharacterized protein MELLADRAFT_84240 [Melampsora larici-populina 98AG31]|uniref:Reverse transcriptase domain-containing protein n=1 Tax=Melampsora larici-populina (strain 98AG31 / pathotype 3-4-7) TaxID=747676 RepID=F4RF06_MELLP|nr:uncharacterized protein MELLADRAFT_84240 [Melampsora larici-populina 98AG31]EGG08735.1 hypothetical protein MELLADRAFT_84240 [Melampsora larici-populina 98AG31]